MLESSVFMGAVISLLCYQAGLWLRKKTGSPIANPLLVAILIAIAVIQIFHVPYQHFQDTAKYVSYLLTPATVALAIPLYKQFHLLKQNAKAILIGIFSGVIASVVSVSLLSMLFHFSRMEWITFLPKSITTAIGMSLSDELGGNGAISAASIIITGVIGNIIAEPVLRLFHIEEPIAKGIGLGSSSHAIGTTKAMELGEIEGAMSSLSIVVSGIMTVVVLIVLTSIVPMF